MFKMQPPSSVYIVRDSVLCKGGCGRCKQWPCLIKMHCVPANRVKFVSKLTILLVFEKYEEKINKPKKNTDREFPDFTVGRKGQVNIFFFF